MKGPIKAPYYFEKGVDKFDLVYNEPRTYMHKLLVHDDKGSKEVYREILLYRIKALVDFSDVKAGDLGGWVPYKGVLSQYGDCWIYKDAAVFADARISGNAKICGDAKVYGEAEITDDAVIDGYAEVYDAIIEKSARVIDHATVCGKSIITGKACVGGTARVEDGSKVTENATVCGNAVVTKKSRVCDSAEVSGSSYILDSQVYGSARVREYAIIRDKSDVLDDAIVKGYAIVKGSIISNKAVVERGELTDCRIMDDAKIVGNANIRNANIGRDAEIHDTTDYLVLGPIGSRDDFTTFYKTFAEIDSKDNHYNDISVCCGCFNGNLREFCAILNEKHRDNHTHRENYLKAISFAIAILDGSLEQINPPEDDVILDVVE